MATPSSPSRRLFENLRLDTGDSALQPTAVDTAHSGRGRGSSVQNRRTAGALGLGVSFALNNSNVDTGNKDRSVSRSHSRRSSEPSFFPPIFSQAPAATPVVTPPEITTNSRPPNRRPSLCYLSSHLFGFEHHTRVRADGAGRGLSRSVSRSTSRSGHRRGSFDGDRILLDGDDYYEDNESARGDTTDDESVNGDYASSSHTGNRNRRRRSMSFGSCTSSIASGSRRGSIVFPSIAVPSFSTHGFISDTERSNLWEEEEVSQNNGSVTSFDLYGTVTNANHMFPTSTPTPTTQTQRHIFRPPSTPRVLPTGTGEEPFLETAPSSPNPFPGEQRRYSSHYDGLAPGGLEDVDVFEEGERIGVGVYLEDRGGWVRDCFGEEEGGLEIGIGGGGEGVEGAPTEMEVIRRLGEGTYAIVYLVREVLSGSGDDDPIDPDLGSDSYLSSPNPSYSPVSLSRPTRPLYHSWSSDPFETAPRPVYGRSFALKCLCKKNLSDDLIEIQRGEAVLHRALPEHEFIVRLYGAYETDDWLFLVLEYCPGQDLFYWLDERQDSSMAQFGDFHSRATSPFLASSPPRKASDLQMQNLINGSADGSDSDEEELLSRTLTQVSTGAALMSSNNRRNTSGDSDHTPPSPSLLASTGDTTLLSRKRLRLISRMFGQMCSAVEACHQVGVAHRDIKPENFIVMDGRGEGGVDGERGRGRGRVVVKITDWGLGTWEEQCEDFDCGSKPYMAYECRNNLQPTYDPRQADVWSLGLVLLNLLYHRNPWADPSLNDPDFSAYVQDPRGFLEDRFEGIGREVAGFLTERVFCDILEMEGNKMRRRVTAGEFGRWASNLVHMMGNGRKRASVSEYTFPLTSTVSRPSPGSRSPLDPTQNGIGSLLSQYGQAFHCVDSPSPVLEPISLDVLDGIEEETFDAANETVLQPSLALIIDTPGRKTPPPAPYTTRQLRSFTNEDDSLPSPSFPTPHGDAGRPAIDNIPVSPLRMFASQPSIPTSPTKATPGPKAALTIPIAIPPRRTSLDASAVFADSLVPNGDIVSPTEEGSVDPLKAKRRKRGARKGKAARAAEENSAFSSAGSPLSMTFEQQRDKVLSDLATASQDLAREVSRSTRSLGTQSTSALDSSTTSNGGVAAAVKKVKPAGMFDRMRNLVSDGNQDLLAFKQRVDEKNASMASKDPTYSAPAKLQGNSRSRIGTMSGDAGGSSRGSAGNHSWGSYDADELARGRAAIGESSSTPWTSSSSRRDRLEKQRRGELSPAPLAVTVSLTTDHTASNGKDWRQMSPHSAARGSYSPAARAIVVAKNLDSAHPSSPPNLIAPPLSISAINHKPTMRSAGTDIADLGRPVELRSASKSTPPRTKVVPTFPILSQSPLSFVTTKAGPSSRNGHAEGNSKTKALGKLLAGISVFNRSQDRSVKGE